MARSCLRSMGHDEPGNGLLLLFRVDDFERALTGVLVLRTRFGEEHHVKPNSGTMACSLSEPHGYYISIRALSAA